MKLVNDVFPDAPRFEAMSQNHLVLPRSCDYYQPNMWQNLLFREWDDHLAFGVEGRKLLCKVIQEFTDLVWLHFCQHVLDSLREACQVQAQCNLCLMNQLHRPETFSKNDRCPSAEFQMIHISDIRVSANEQALTWRQSAELAIMATTWGFIVQGRSLLVIVMLTGVLCRLRLDSLVNLSWVTWTT